MQQFENYLNILSAQYLIHSLDTVKTIRELSGTDLSGHEQPGLTDENG